MHETGLGWFMGWKHIWYVGTGWRKRLVVMLLGGHAWLWSSALSKAAFLLLRTGCRTGWPGTSSPWAYKAVRDRYQRGEGSTGRAVVSLHSAWSSSSTLGDTTRRCGPKQWEMCCQAWVTWESASTTLQWHRVLQPVYPTPGNLWLSISPLCAYALLLSFGRNVSAPLTTGLNFTWIKSLWKPKLGCWRATQKYFLSAALPSLGFALSETQSGHGGVSDLVVDGSERNIILL